MPKRSFSDLQYGEDASSCLQAKIHVGQKEVDRGICSATNMKAVYQRTLDLLFQGAKQMSAQGPDLVQRCPQPANFTAPSKNCQMILTSDCQLSTDQRKPDLIQPFGISLACQCPSCSSTNCVMHDRCVFCEKFVCSACLKSCNVCCGEFCTRCSMENYSTEDGRICFSCAG